MTSREYAGPRRDDDVPEHEIDAAHRNVRRQTRITEPIAGL